MLTIAIYQVNGLMKEKENLQNQLNDLQKKLEEVNLKKYILKK